MTPYEPSNDVDTFTDAEGVETTTSASRGKSKISKGLVAAYYDARTRLVTFQLGEGPTRTDFIHLMTPLGIREVREMVLQIHDNPKCAEDILGFEEGELGEAWWTGHLEDEIEILID